MTASTIGVFCGSQFGNEAAYRDAADALGRAIATQGYRLVYGGGSLGLMGVVADGALAAGGQVTGIMPDFLARADILHPKVEDTRFVTDLFARKALMLSMCDAFIALPGGLGTLDELLEVVTWRQLNQWQGPLGLLDIQGFFAPFFAMLHSFSAAGFIHADEIEKLHRYDDVDTLLASVTAAVESPR